MVQGSGRYTTETTETAKAINIEYTLKNVYFNGRRPSDQVAQGMDMFVVYASGWEYT